MAVNPIKPITASSATATNGSLTITVFGSVDCSNVYQGTMVHLGGFTPVEAVSGTAVDSGTGNSTITLRSVWPEVTTTARLTAFNSIEGLGQAIQRAQDVVANTAAIEALSGSGLIEKTGVTSYAVAPLTAAGKALLDDTSNTAQRATLGLGTSSTKDATSGANDSTVDKVMSVGSAGILGNAVTITDFNTVSGEVGSKFLAATSGAANPPTGSGVNNWAGFKSQRFTSTSFEFWAGLTQNEFFARCFSTSYKDWVKFYHSGNSVNPLDYGLGVSTAPNITDFTLALPAGHYRALLSTTTGGPDTAAYTVSVTVENAVDGAGQTFIVKRTSAAATVGRMWYGYRNGSTGAINWNELYHSNNFSKNKIIAAAAGQVMEQGIAVSATAIRFYRPIHNVAKPSSLILSTPTDFDIKNLVSGTVASGVTPVINGTTSAGMLVFDVTGLSGLTADLDYILTAASSTSSLGWNND